MHRWRTTPCGADRPGGHRPLEVPYQSLLRSVVEEKVHALKITDRSRRTTFSTENLLSDRDDPAFRKRRHDTVVLKARRARSMGVPSAAADVTLPARARPRWGGRWLARPSHSPSPTCCARRARWHVCPDRPSPATPGRATIAPRSIRSRSSRPRSESLMSQWPGSPRRGGAGSPPRRCSAGWRAATSGWESARCSAARRVHPYASMRHHRGRSIRRHSPCIRGNQISSDPSLGASPFWSGRTSSASTRSRSRSFR
jgi:hypothetical protein